MRTFCFRKNICRSATHKAMVSKFLYNLKGIARILTPNILTQASLESQIQQIFTRFSPNILDSMKARLRYYHKISSPFSLAPSIQSHDAKLPQITDLKHIFNKHTKARYFSAYFYDMYEFTRYFDSRLWLAHEFGDVNYYLSLPAITKSRPIAQHPQSQNSILFKLDKNRHFHFINDKIPYEAKRDILFWRGAAYQANRQEFLKRFFSAKFCDIAHTGSKSILHQFRKNRASIQEHLGYKFLLSLEGNDVASNLKWILSSNSVCLTPKLNFETWFMEGILQAGVHYIEIAPNYDDLETTIAYYKAHPHKAKEIISNAHNFISQFCNPAIEHALCLLVLRKYFYLSRQIAISTEEKEFMFA